MKIKKILILVLFGVILLSCKDNTDISSSVLSEDSLSELSSFSNDNEESSESNETSNSYVEFPYLPPTSEDEN